MVDDTSARRTCLRCGESYPLSMEICPNCNVWIETGEPYSPAPPLLSLDLIVALILPLAGPLAYYLVVPDRRSDLAELTGVILWPAIYFFVGVYFVGQTCEKLKRETEDWTSPSVFLKLYQWLSNVGLAMLAVFEGATVIAASEWRWNYKSNETAVMVSYYAVGFYLAYATCTILAALTKRRTMVQIEARQAALERPVDGGPA